MEINIDGLKDLSIFQLRTVGRKIGVASPTTLKRAELIEQITKVHRGEIEPYRPKTKQGRPPKDLLGVDALLDVIIPKNVLQLNTECDSMYNEINNTTLTFAQDEIKYLADCKEVVACGLFVKLENKAGILRKGIDSDVVSSMVYITPNIVAESKLRDGDEVLCNANFVGDSRPMLLSSIISINGVEVDKYERDNLLFDDMEHVFNESYYTFESKNPVFQKLNGKIEVGSNVYFYGDKYRNIINAIDLTSSIKKTQNFKLLYINLSITNKEKQLIKKMPNVEIYCNNFEDSRSKQKQTLELFIERVKRLVESGNHLIIMVDDAVDIGLLTYEQNRDIKLLKVILSMSKQTVRGSVTTFAFFPKDTDTDFQKLVINTVKKMEDVKIEE